MAQLSRPYQLGLLGIVLLAAVWLVLLQGHSSSPTSSGAGASAPAVQTVTTTTAVPSKPAASGSKVHKGSAPGVAGLTGAVSKAQGAVATSQQNAKALEAKSAQASNERSAAAHPSTPSSKAPAAVAPAKAVASPTSATKSAPSSVAKHTAAKPAKPLKPVAPNASTRSTVAVNQRVVEGQLAKGKISLILFWDSRGADDVSVRHAVQGLSGNSHLRIAVNYARASQVASYGSITRGIQVYGTPTLLIVNKKGQTTTLTGLQDGYAIEQAIDEARHA